MAELDQQTVVVIGGTSGIGLATAQRLAQNGAKVIIAGRDETKLAPALAQAGTGVSGRNVDATSRASLDTFFAGIGPFDHLVLSLSGGAGGGPFRSLDLDSLRRGFELKFFANLQAAQAALTSLRPGGSITFVTSISARMGNPGTSGLAAINGALERMIPALALELKPIRVNAVSPGMIDTAWWDRFPAEQKEAAFKVSAAATPVGRVGQPDEVALAIAMLVENGFMTGTVIECDGGSHLK